MDDALDVVEDVLRFNWEDEARVGGDLVRMGAAVGVDAGRKGLGHLAVLGLELSEPVFGALADAHAGNPLVGGEVADSPVLGGLAAGLAVEVQEEVTV